MCRKHVMAILLILAMLMGITGCGSSKKTDKKDRETKTSSEDISDKDTSDADASSDVPEESVDDYSGAQEFSYKVRDKNRRGIGSVEVKLISDISFKVDMYEDEWSDSVPGVVGVAVCVYWTPTNYNASTSFSSKLPDPNKTLLIFNYEEDKLMGVPEENLLLLYSSDDAFVCSEVAGAKVDVDKNQESFLIGSLYRNVIKLTIARRKAYNVNSLKMYCVP